MNYSVYVCPTHGIISEREMEDAPMAGWSGGDFFGEAEEPFGCPCFDSGPTPCWKELKCVVLVPEDHEACPVLTRAEAHFRRHVDRLHRNGHYEHGQTIHIIFPAERVDAFYKIIEVRPNGELMLEEID